MKRPSRRVVMYALVAAQLVVLAGIVTPQELNIAFDNGATVDIEIVQARATRDPFRGAYVSGQSALDLDGSTAPLPAGLRGGDRVVVVFAVQSGRRPRIISVERGRPAAAFTATTFTIPGRVLAERDRMSYRRREGGVVASVGKPPVTIELDLPASIAIDDSALGQLSSPSVVTASLHAGFLGHRYFTDVRLAGRAWSPDVRFAYDDTRQRLLVLAPREASGRARYDAPVQSDLFVFDAAGKELATAEVRGHVVDGLVDAGGNLLALVSDHRWTSSDVSLVRLGDDGRVEERGPRLAFDRVLGYDAGTSSFWVVAAPTSTPPQAPVFIQRMGLAGTREPRLGPFDSVPRAVVSAGNDVWVLEPDRHRVTRADAATGRVVREYRDFNAPAEIAVDRGRLYVVEANRTQLTCVGEDGRVLWRVPRFQGLTWSVPDPPTGGGFIGALTFDGAPAGVLRFDRDGAITRLPATGRPTPRLDWRRHVGADVLRSARDGRLIFFAGEAITMLSADGTTVQRVVGFRFPAAQRLRS